MRINYIAESEAFVRHARDNGYSASEQLLWRALFTIFNEQAGRNDGVWPDGFISVTNKTLLSWLPYGENTLLATRSSMVNREIHPAPLIEYKKGIKNKVAPQYRMVYLSSNYRKCGNNGGNDGGNQQGNNGGNDGGNQQGNMGDIYSKQNETSQNQSNQEKLYYNNAWKHDARAQRAVALKILDRLPGLEADGFPHGVDVICQYLGDGMSPEGVLKALESCKKASYIPAHLHSYAVLIGIEEE